MAHSHTIALLPGDSIAQLRLALRSSDDEAQKTHLRAIIGIKEGSSHRSTARISHRYLPISDFRVTIYRR